MLSSDAPGGCWPTPEQEWLLRAAFERDDKALAAWARWKETARLDELDQASYRLLPMVYRSLRLAGVRDSHDGLLKGVYYRTWYENQMHMHRAADLLRAFESAGIPTLILKGASLTLLYYQDYGLRSMGDFDILVPTAQAPAALQVLHDRGFSSSRRLREVFKEGYLRVTHAFGFVDSQGWEVDLHWHVLVDCCWPEADEDFWAAALSITVNGVPTRALTPADELLYICVHGLKWNYIPPFRWVADALTLLQRVPDMDWNRVVQQAERLRLSVPLREALGYLARVWQAPIPVSALTHLASLSVSRSELKMFEAATSPVDSIGLAYRLWLHYQHYLRTARPTRRRDQLLGFARFLQNTWGLDSLDQLPGYAVRGGMERTKRLLAWRKERFQAAARASQSQ
ncbi:MAG: nucleotidyltransferase family protein [Anaerolineae bacterium]|nr:nucleotidyltransferase family protein [Anaerolineae bacterium]